MIVKYGRIYLDAEEEMKTLNKMMWASTREEVELSELITQAHLARLKLKELMAELINYGAYGIKTLRDADNRYGEELDET